MFGFTEATLLVTLLIPRPDVSDMVRLPAGAYRPLYSRVTDRPVQVAAFRLDRDAVTRGEFLAFVRRTPAWRRSAVSSGMADRVTYLADWRGDLDAGSAASLRRPVTGVSWHAARAYCAAVGKRLPTTAEWEYAAAASATKRDATRDPEFTQRLVALYSSRPRPLPPVDSGAVNVYGVRGLHGLAWEWVEDFQGAHREHAHGASERHDTSCASAALGAADPTNFPAFLRQAVRSGSTETTSMETLGFRCAA